MKLFQKQPCDWLIVGLGNPGKEYDKTRHNVGFEAVRLLAGKLGVKIDRSKFDALTCLTTAEGQKVLLLLPQTFMNLSGRAVAQAAQFYKLPPERVLVIYDDIDLPVGRIRVRGKGSAGGHNGIKSIIASIASADFPRVKIGVGAKPHPDYELADWVLSKFTAQEQKQLLPAIERAADATLEVIAGGVSQAECKFNGAV